jgi:hypothetical protein
MNFQSVAAKGLSFNATYGTCPNFICFEALPRFGMMLLLLAPRPPPLPLLPTEASLMRKHTSRRTPFDYWAYDCWTPIDFWAIFALPGQGTSRLAFLPMVLALIACTLGPFQQLASSDDQSQRVNHGDLSLQRVTDGLQVLYDFRTLDTGVLRDLSGNLIPLNLTLREPKNATASPQGLVLQGKPSITTDSPADGLSAQLQRSGALSLEVWIHPQSVSQNGPARVLTLSRNGNERNFTLGQDGDKMDFRLRTTATSTNGIPSLVTKSGVVQTAPMHVVCTHSRDGRTQVFVNGKMVAEQQIKGDFSNWSSDYRLAVGNELTGDRPWAGSISLAAIFNRALSSEEVERNYQAGLPDTAESQRLTRADLNARHFETNIAPILARHCLECHDTSTHKGGLDLSSYQSAIKGGDSGAVLVAEKSDASSLWTSVESDEMPHKRTPLSAQEKAALKKWIDDGAQWRLPRIDPANYVQGSGSQKVFVQRLTVPEYIESVRSLLGVDITQQAQQILPRDLRADGFSNTAYNLTVDLAHVEAYMTLAELIVQQLDAEKLVRRYTKSREATDENLAKFIDPFGQLVFRGPITSRERQSLLGVSTSVAAAGGNFEEIVRYIVSAMLQSPRFLYRIEAQRGDGNAWPVNSYELASRLSYILWGGPPDEELLRAAEKNALSGEGLEAQVDRLLRDERAVQRSKQFISEWLNLGHLSNLQPAATRFPAWDGALAHDMRAETLAYFEEIVWKQRRPMAELLNAQVTFATPRLAEYYNLKKRDDKASTKLDDRLQRFDLADVPERGGLLTQGSTLTVGGDDASTVTRGLFVMHELLRGVVKDPPPCVDATPIPSQPGLTQRTIAEQRLQNSACAGCHAKFEPLSFGLERFDGLGAYHEIDEFGNALRQDGTILFPGQAESVPYQTSAELMNLLAASDRVKESITWKMTQFAMGRPLGAADAHVLSDIHQSSQAAGGRWIDIMKSIVLSELVQTTRTLPDQDR